MPSNLQSPAMGIRRSGDSRLVPASPMVSHGRQATVPRPQRSYGYGACESYSSPTAGPQRVYASPRQMYTSQPEPPSRYLSPLNRQQMETSSRPIHPENRCLSPRFPDEPASIRLPAPTRLPPPS